MRASVAIAALAATNVRAQDAALGTAVVIGQVKVKETGQPLGYSVISLPESGRQLFTSERGTFTLWNLRAGALRIRFKHIGYSPRDTVITLRDNDTLRVEMALSLLAIQLPTVHVSGTCGTKQADEATAGILTELFDQVQQNADRYRLLADSNPFKLVFHRVRGYRFGNDKIQATAVDSVTRAARPESPYRPRHVIQIGDAPDGSHTYELAPPEIADFADTAFINNHCFTYAGQTLLDGDSLIAVEFEPVPSLKKEIDFRGTMYVRSVGYQLVRSEMELNNVPDGLRKTGALAVTISTRFTEVVPGIPMVDRLQANTRRWRGQPAYVELLQVIDIKWLKGPP